jgi:glyoxylase-like metal-dependent hydrolase (beta-lactamase superfamily II)
MGAFLVRSGDTVALVDSGLGDATVMGVVGGRMLDNLAALGVSPGDVTDVIYTHLHTDHIGWSTANGSPMFPGATHRCAAAEWQHFMVDTKDVDEVYPGSVNAPRNAFHHLNPVLERFETFDGDGPLLPGIDVLAAPGHTPGSTVVVLSSGTERAMLLGDAVHCPVQLLDSEWGALFDLDPVLARKTRNALAAELEDSNTRVGFSHVPHLQPGRVVSAQGRRRWVV